MGFAQARVSGQILATILGGFGVFFVWRSFEEPLAGLNAALHLGAALAISFCLYPELIDLRGRGVTRLRLVLARMMKRRR